MIRFKLRILLIRRENEVQIPVREEDIPRKEPMWWLIGDLFDPL